MTHYTKDIPTKPPPHVKYMYMLHVTCTCTSLFTKS